MYLRISRRGLCKLVGQKRLSKYETFELRHEKGEYILVKGNVRVTGKNFV
jgi:hypothetical protein